MSKKIVILGPTSSGKTSLALKFCQKFNGEIVSVDSRQVYKLMDIGTGKLPVGISSKVIKEDGYWELDYGLKHIKVWGYDIAKPDNYFSVFDYFSFVKKLKLTSPVTLFVGGTGFYFDILLGRKHVSGVVPNEKLRTELSLLSKEELYEKLQKLNFEKAQKIDKNNSVRLIRALEIELSSKNTMEENAPEKNLQILDESTLIIGLRADKSLIYERVDKWVDFIFDNGFLEEVQNLIKMGYGNSRPMHSLNYKTAKKLLTGELTKKEAIERIKFDNHAYIRRQETYFKKIPDVRWFDIAEEGFDSSIERLVESKLDE